MTRALTSRSRRVVAFEIDRDLASSLRDTAPANLTIVEGDFLDVTPDALQSVLSAEELARPIRAAGNLPYNVASPILFRLLELYESGVRLTDAHLMLQREVAERLVARPGTREYGLLSILIGHSAAVEKVLTLPPGAFRPAPKVHSAVVRLRFHRPEPPVMNRQTFDNLVRLAFTHRRKTLGNSLGKKGRVDFLAALRTAGIDPSRRPEMLSIAEFVRLADAVTALGLPASP
jgi:16S rRNA (adenine1518-N6/adenine1519-N6)-dimethyltransferase